MNIVIVSSVFLPEPIVSARTSQSLAHELTALGHVVKVITNFPNRPAGQIYEGYKRSIFSSENTPSGYSITRCFSTFSKSSSIFSRLLENVSFGFSSSLSLLFTKKPDMVYCNSWPVFATGLVVFLCKLRKVPVVLSIQDIYPESLFVQKRLDADNILYRALLFIDKWISKNSSALVFVSKIQLLNYIVSRGIAQEKAFIVPNWVSKDNIELIPKSVYRVEAGISLDTFLIVYGGNIGKAAGLDVVIQYITPLPPEKKIVILLAGAGSELANCQLLAKQREDLEIIFVTPWRVSDTSKVLAAADLLLLPTQGDQSLVSVPSKLIAYMLSSKPIIAIASLNSEIGNLIKSVNCGWVIEPDKLGLITAKIIEISECSSKMLETIGSSGREFALKNFTCEFAIPKMIKIFEEIGLEHK